MRTEVFSRIFNGVTGKIYDNGNGTFDVIAIKNGDIITEWQNLPSCEVAMECIDEFELEMNELHDWMIEKKGPVQPAE